VWVARVAVVRVAVVRVAADMKSVLRQAGVGLLRKCEDVARAQIENRIVGFYGTEIENSYVQVRGPRAFFVLLFV